MYIIAPRARKASSLLLGDVLNQSAVWRITTGSVDAGHPTAPNRLVLPADSPWRHKRPLGLLACAPPSHASLRSPPRHTREPLANDVELVIIREQFLRQLVKEAPAAPRRTPPTLGPQERPPGEPPPDRGAEMRPRALPTRPDGAARARASARRRCRSCRSTPSRQSRIATSL
jgi:hypothetical protein